MSDLPPLEITAQNRRRTGTKLRSMGASGKGSYRRPGENLQAFEKGYAELDFQQPYCPGCLRDHADCACPPAEAP
jgi:hypothetical protein